MRLVVSYSTEESILSERLLIGLLYRSFVHHAIQHPTM